MTLENSPFYLLDPPESERHLCRYARDRTVIREEIGCTLNPGHARIGRFFSELSVVVPGVIPDDILFTWASECLVSKHVLAVMEQYHLKGFWTQPAKAVLKKTGHLIEVLELKVEGWGGIVSPESGIRQDEFCPQCKLSHWTDLTNPDALIDLQKWDGSDFFMIWPFSGHMFVTKKVHDVFQKHGFTGAKFSKSFLTPRIKMGYSPQLLSHLMSEKRAREIGDPLGIC